MTEVTRNLLVGLFVLASIAVLAVLMVWFGEAPQWLGTGDWTLRITGVREIRGIGDGTPVLLNGVEIGRVTKLDFEDRDRPGRGVIICVNIRAQYAIPRGATAKVYGSMFGLGSGQVNIIVEPQPMPAFLDPKENPSIPGEMASMIREFIPEDFTRSFQRTVDHIGGLAAATTPLAESLGKLVEERSMATVAEPNAVERGITANLTTMIERLDKLVANINAVLGDEDVQGNAKEVVRDLKNASEGIRELVALWKRETQQLVDKVHEGMDRTDENLSRSLTTANEVLEHLDDGAKSLAAVGLQVNEGQGTVGRLIYDDRLYESAVLTLKRMTALLDRLDRIFGKIERDGYFIVGRPPSGLLRKKFPVPGAGAESR